MAFLVRLAGGGILGFALAGAACSDSASSLGSGGATTDGGVDGGAGVGFGSVEAGTKDGAAPTDGAAPSSGIVDVFTGGKPTRIVIDGGTLYFYDEAANGIFAVPKDGSGPAVPLAGRGGAGEPNDLIVTPGVLVTAYDFDLTGCSSVLGFPESGAPTTLVSGCGDGFHPVNVASDGASLFFIDVAEGRGTVTDAGISTIIMQPLGSTTRSVVGTVGGAGYEKSVDAHIAVDDTSVFWSALEPDATTRIMNRMAKTGGPVTSLSSAISGVADFVLDGDKVFVGGTEISWVPKLGGALTQVASTSLEVKKLAVDADNVYWIEGPLDGLVQKAPKSGAGPTTTLHALADDVLIPPAFAVDEGFVYWVEQPLDQSNYAKGKIRRIAK